MQYSDPVFFFSSFADHQDLHSFPTRRSSDLRPRIRRTGRRCAGWSDAAASPPTWRSPRSEEHTSELQSQFHLVCRLLLEKKKAIEPETIPYLWSSITRNRCT